MQILADIARWMARKEYLKGEGPDGLILLHPATKSQAGGSEWDGTRLLEKILGPSACRRVVIATTMWDELVTTRQDALEKNLQARVGKGGVWHDMYRQGAKMEKHDNTVESAHAIIRQLSALSTRTGGWTRSSTPRCKRGKDVLLTLWLGKSL